MTTSSSSKLSQSSELKPPRIEPNPTDTNPLLQNQQDLEAASPCCRICLESHYESGDPLISPCKCKGTQQYVHRCCLDHWRSVKEGLAFSQCTTCKAQYHLRVDEFEHSLSSKVRFRLFVARDIFLVFLAVQLAIALLGGVACLIDNQGEFRNVFSRFDISKHPIPFYYFVGVGCFFALLGLYGLIRCDSSNNNDPCSSGCRNCCHGCSPPAPAYIYTCTKEECFALVFFFIFILALFGIAYSFVFVIMTVQKIWLNHYHILTKRELTKEYVVEDLAGCYTSPKLDPEHEERLKMLKLL